MNNARPSGTTLGSLLLIAFLSAPGQTALAQQQHTLPWSRPPIPPSRDSCGSSITRIPAERWNIHAIDDSGERFGPVALELAAGETVHFTSNELEGGNADKGISPGIGSDGEGDWRLELTADAGMDIEPLAYIRTSDGFVTSMHDVVEAEYLPGTPGVDDGMRHVVRFFNPGSNRNQVSRLRIINTAGMDGPVTIRGVDDDGEPAPGGAVTLTLGPYQARTITAQQLEEGADFLTGSLGDGAGKWQLIVEVQPGGSKAGTAGRAIQVMSLLYSVQTENLANLSSRGAGNDSNRGGDGIDWIWGGAGDDILNPGDNDDQYDAVLGSTGNDTIVYTDSGPSAYQALAYFALETGIRATINGITNVATVDKGMNGTDTIVDIRNPLDATRNPPIGGFGIVGTDSGDQFDLTLDEGQWMEVRGEGGDDMINIVSGRVILNFRHTTNSLDIDLEAGLVNDDGFGGVDTIIGDVYQLEFGPGDNTLLGSSTGDRILSGAGDDTINPGASTCDSPRTTDHVYGSIGDDTIIYTDVGADGCNTLQYNIPWLRRQPLSEGQGIDVTINGVTNRGTVRKGGDGTDTLVDIATQLSTVPHGGTTLYGTFSDDIFHLTLDDGQWMSVRGMGGNDTFHASGSVRIDYRDAPAGVNVNLADGTASEDGWGGVDTIETVVYELRGTPHTDVLVGSDNDERFIGMGW